MNLVLFGAPGAGKGSLSAALKEKLHIPHISTGEIFRHNIEDGTEVGKKAKVFIDKGQLVPDDVVIQMVVNRLHQPDVKKGFILDGFPRTTEQAKALVASMKEMNMTIDVVVDLEVSDDLVIFRLSGRRVCHDCDTVYHVVNHPPKKEGVCDICGQELVQRKDDNEETVRSRLKVYHDTANPIKKYFDELGLLEIVDGSQESELIVDYLQKKFVL